MPFNHQTGLNMSNEKTTCGDRVLHELDSITYDLLVTLCYVTMLPKGDSFPGSLLREPARRIMSRLRVVSNFGDTGKIHARARENGLPRGDAPRGAAPTLVARLLAGAHFRARARVFRENAKIRDSSQSS